MSPVNALHGDLGIVADGDVVIAASYSGETAELLNILPALKRFDVRMICLTGDPGSTLARHSDIILDCSVEKEACPLNLAPTSSTTVLLALGDALAMVLLEVRGFREDDFLKFHPGGRLGRYLLQRVRDIMRGEDRMPIVTPETQVLAVLHSMNEHRAGVAVVPIPTANWPESSPTAILFGRLKKVRRWFLILSNGIWCGTRSPSRVTNWPWKF